MQCGPSSTHTWRGGTNGLPARPAASSTLASAPLIRSISVGDGARSPAARRRHFGAALGRSHPTADHTGQAAATARAATSVPVSHSRHSLHWRSPPTAAHAAEPRFSSVPAGQGRLAAHPGRRSASHQ